MSREPCRVRPTGLALGGANEVPILAVALSPSSFPELTESWVNATTINGLQ
jgi:hypothetical protein